MMQDHERRESGSEEQEGEVFAFHEVVYPPRPAMNRWLQYFIGVGIGAIPLAAMVLSMGIMGNGAVTGIFGGIALYGFIAVFLGMVVCLCVPRVRFVGYGLLTMVLISPVVWFIACVVTFRACYHSC